MNIVSPNDSVGWQWAGGIATGTVESVHPERTSIETKDKTIVRNGTLEDPAVVIIHDNGTKVLKLQHEIQKVR